MYRFSNNVLHAAFHYFFTKATSVHNYNTRFVAKHSYYLPYAMANLIFAFKVQLCGMLLMIM